MANRLFILNKLLYFLANNSSLWDNESFILNVSAFYINEEVLSNEFEIFKIKKIDKCLSRKELRKNDKLTKCLTMLKTMKINGIRDKCAIFVSANLSKMPSFEKFIEINFENVEKDLKDMLDKQQACLGNALDHFAEMQFKSCGA
ncbi:hypothetical protein HELRODRAFT_164911 [Helobdella robusta]|uniref:Uncharacterized protein n=1 Tax=Helobdella robusta TaxID=6412 RepID=T1EVY7_HELRO|nr:hypothetical protein HELRODRAFT_164911 [Helobdella robusta]ESN92794.1 hypothetical protein HELRODRAFT_164911 [Helobdella robusta]